MQCPKCGLSENDVIDSRKDGFDGIRRRRECKGCGNRFTTHEYPNAKKMKILYSKMKQMFNSEEDIDE